MLKTITINGCVRCVFTDGIAAGAERLGSYPGHAPVASDPQGVYRLQDGRIVYLDASPRLGRGGEAVIVEHGPEAESAAAGRYTPDPENFGSRGLAYDWSTAGSGPYNESWQSCHG